MAVSARSVLSYLPTWRIQQMRAKSADHRDSNSGYRLHLRPTQLSGFTFLPIPVPAPPGMELLQFREHARGRVRLLPHARGVLVRFGERRVDVDRAKDLVQAEA